jgi:hypothetical protein
MGKKRRLAVIEDVILSPCNGYKRIDISVNTHITVHAKKRIEYG